MERIEKSLMDRSEKRSLRSLSPADRRAEGRIHIEGRDYVDLSSNDYLGLSSHPKLKEASRDAVDSLGTSSCASRLLSGDLKLHHELEEEIALFKNKESALIFNSGYQANTGIIGAIYGRGDAIFSDRLNHASIVDGITLSGAKLFRFRHNDPGHLENMLKKERKRFKEALIITESIFSMDGDRAPLKELVDLKERYNCRIMVDEAHATGIFGARGSGVVEDENLEEDVDLIMGTFGKALGGFGAYIASTSDIIRYLVNFCRSFIYSTSLPPSIVAVNMESLKVIKDEPWRRKGLLENAVYLRSELQKSGLKARGSSQIIPLIIGDNEVAQDFSERLKDAGYRALPIRPPTVPEGESRIRFSLTYNHTKDILKGLLDEIYAFSK